MYERTDLSDSFRSCAVSTAVLVSLAARNLNFQDIMIILWLALVQLTFAVHHRWKWNIYFILFVSHLLSSVVVASFHFDSVLFSQVDLRIRCKLWSEWFTAHKVRRSRWQFIWKFYFSEFDSEFNFLVKLTKKSGFMARWFITISLPTFQG